MNLDDYLSLHNQWSFPTEIRFGPGRIAELAAACEAHGLRRPLVAMDAGLTQLPLAREIQAHMEAAGLGFALFCDMRGNPTLKDLEAGLGAFRAGAHDGVVAIGGGSALDVGKLIAFMHGQSRPVWDFEDREDWWQRADAESIAPVIAVPTTAGTGSEVGRAGVLTDESDNTKKIIFHPAMMPRCVIADPQLSVGLPAAITAATGMDALSHNLEAWCSRTFHPLAEGIALEGMRLIHTWLERAVQDGGDIQARACMLAASCMGAVAFQKGLGGMHAMSHPCSSLFGTHHGLTNGVVMPYVLLRNRPAIEARIAALSAYLRLEGGFDGFLDWILRLRAAIGIPHDLARIGVKPDSSASVERMARMAEMDPANATNPIPLGCDDFQRLYASALSGDLDAACNRGGEDA